MNTHYQRAIDIAAAAKGESLSEEDQQFTVRFFDEIGAGYQVATEAGRQGRAILAILNARTDRAARKPFAASSNRSIALARKYIAACQALAWMDNEPQQTRWLEQARIAKGIKDGAGVLWLARSVRTLAANPSMPRRLDMLREFDSTLPFPKKSSSGGRPSRQTENGTARFLASWWYRISGALPSRGSAHPFMFAVYAACSGMGVPVPSDNAMRIAVAWVYAETNEGVSTSEN